MHNEGQFGDVIYAESEYLHSVDIANIKKLENENHWRLHIPVIKYLTHNLGPLLYIMNDSVVSASCIESDIRYNPYKKAKETAVAVFKTKKGAIIKILICFGGYVGFDHNFRIIGTKGMIETDNIKSVMEAHSFARLSGIPNSIDEKIDIPVTTVFPGENINGHFGADIKMFRAFVDCIVNNTKPPVDVELGIKMSLPGIIAHESAKNGGKPLNVPQYDEL